MFKLDNTLLEELGLGTLPAEEKNRMLAHIYETLEMRVGMKLAEQMTNEQLDEFESFIDRNDEPGALKWLETNFPNYKDVVAQELEGLKAEVKVAAPQIVAASVQAQSQVQHPQMPAEPPQPSAGNPYAAPPQTPQYPTPAQMPQQNPDPNSPQT